MKTLIFLAVFATSPCFAQSGADILLNDLGEKPAAAAPVHTKKNRSKKETAAEEPIVVQRTGDAFQMHLADLVNNDPELSFDIRQWAQNVLTNDYAKAAHLWTAIQPSIPENFHYEAEATQVYLLWKLGLNQTFFDQWIKDLANPAYVKSAPELLLETLVTPGLDAWLLQTGVVVSPEQATIVERLPETRPFMSTLKAWNDVRKEKETDAILAQLPADNKLTRFIAQTSVYAHLRKGDLKGAAKILKNSVEPAIAATHDLELLAKYDLSIARILYQAGQLPAAEEFYLKIPNKSDSYVTAREELSWVYLRRGDMSKLRGELKALASPVFKDRFQPEVFLLRSVSNLKMCFYDQVDTDLAEFSKSNEKWAKTIDQALANPKIPAPPQLDEYAQMSERATAGLESEMKKLTALEAESIGATLPAVGPQKHWKDYVFRAQADFEEAKKHQNEEYTRIWKNQRSALSEAIKKMRFVKVEYDSQVRQLTAANEVDGAKKVASNTNAPAAEILKDDKDQQTFPVSGGIWSDEFFKLRSAAQAKCLKKAATR
jgi:tetratricopeptide (TPR) repeat protein